MKICRLAVLLAILFDVSLMQEEEPCFCSLCDVCEVRNRRFADALSTSSSNERTLSCQNIQPGTPTVTWTVENVGSSPMNITPNGESITQSAFNLCVRNVNASFEGLYFCSVDQMGRQNAGCLVIRGRAYYETCPSGSFTLDGCSEQESVAVQAQTNYTFDLRVTYRDGGVCRNQTIRRLEIYRDGLQVYSCPNVVSTEREPCNSTSKYHVDTSQCDQTMCSGCGAGNALCELQCCKYRLLLTIMDFNSSDPGVYQATFEVNEDGGVRRDMIKTFNLSLIPEVPTTTAQTSSGVESSGTSTGTMSSNQQGLGAGAAVGITIVAIFLFLLIVVVIIVVVYCFIKKKGLYWMTKKPGQELKKNGPESAYTNACAIDDEKGGQFNGNYSIVSGRTNLSRKEKGSSVVGSELPFDLTRDLFSESQRV